MNINIYDSIKNYENTNKSFNNSPINKMLDIYVKSKQQKSNAPKTKKSYLS